jgi:HK97 family phage major capsid protein
MEDKDRVERKKIVDQMDVIVKRAEAEGRDISEGEGVVFDALDKAVQAIDERSKPSNPIPMPSVRTDNGETVKPYGAIGLTYRQLFYGRDDVNIPVVERAEDFCRRMGSTRAMTSGSLVEGGASVPEYWFSDIYRQAYQESICLPRVRTFPMLSNTLHIPAMDSESQQDGFFGGVGASWLAEAAAASEVTPKTRIINLGAHKLALYISASREVIEDSLNLAGVLGQQMVFALQQTVDEVILTGDGLAKPLGVINCPAAIDYSRAVGNQIAFADVAGMFARLHPAFFSGAVWVAHPSTIPQLLVLADASGRYIWQPAMGMTQGVPNMPLLGLPVLFTDKLPALGTRGDLCLINFGAYAFGLRQGAQLESTNAAAWLNDLVSYRCIMRLDGCGLLAAPITPRTGGATMSPFVVLD